MTYVEKLKDPRWQRKRLEIMQRDDFACKHCLDKKTTLNVHHKYYEKDKSPWEYSDDCYITLCNNCHQEEHELKKYFIYEIGFILSKQDSLKCEIYFNIIEKLPFMENDDVIDLSRYLSKAFSKGETNYKYMMDIIKNNVKEI